MKKISLFFGVIILIGIIGCASDNDIGLYTFKMDGNGGVNNYDKEFIYYEVSSGWSKKIYDSDFTQFKKSGYYITNWNTKADGTGKEYKVGDTFTVKADSCLYAIWKANDVVVVPVVPEEGIYVGIIKFADTATDITYDKPILLDDTGLASLKSKLDSEYKIANDIGTSMFYGVHKALANLTKNAAATKFPDSLVSVNIVTFTDGLDLQSAGLSRMSTYTLEGQKFNENSAYASYIKDEIRNKREISNIKIAAYSVGVPGTDTDTIDFENNLKSIASDDANAYKIKNFSEVQKTFDKIAEDLKISETITKFTMVTNLLDDGTKVKMTFDVNDKLSASASSSTKFIEGTFVSGNKYSLKDINYSSGISSNVSAGATIDGTTIGTNVNFVFNNIKGYDPSIDFLKTKQWLLLPGSTSWQHNSEYSSSGSSTTTVTYQSAVVYLVLDCSKSLSQTEIDIIREASKDFIDSLFKIYKQ